METAGGTDVAVGLVYEQRSRLTAELLAAALNEHGFSDRVRPRERTHGAFLDVVHAGQPLGSSRVVVLVDPVDEQAEHEVERFREAAEHRQTGVLVIANRPSYLGVRRWRRKRSDGRPLASGYLGAEARIEDVLASIRACAQRPADSGVWPDGPTHPDAYAKTFDGQIAAEIRAEPRVHELIVMEARSCSRPEIAERLGVAPGTLTDMFTRLRKDCGVANPLALGVRLARLGLLEDLPPDLAPASRGRAAARPAGKRNFVVDEGGVEVEDVGERVGHIALHRRYSERLGRPIQDLSVVPGQHEIRNGVPTATLGHIPFGADRAAIERRLRECFDDGAANLNVRFRD